MNNKLITKKRLLFVYVKGLFFSSLSLSLSQRKTQECIYIFIRLAKETTSKIEKLLLLIALIGRVDQLKSCGENL